MKTWKARLGCLAALCGLGLAVAVVAAEPDADDSTPPPQDQAPPSVPDRPDDEAESAAPSQLPTPDSVTPEPAPEPEVPAMDEPPPQAELQGADESPAAAAPTTPDPAAAPSPTSSSAPRARPESERAQASAPADDTATASPTTSTEPVTLVKPGEKGLRLNFRGVPLEMVLNYLSEAAGFIIVLETEVRGKVDVWSNHPLDQEEALTLLNTVLNKNGYAALRNGRMLTVIGRDDARRRDTPVVIGSDPGEIPKSDEIVTQILPVRFINATQLSRDLATLIPASANVAANEGGNALLITDTQSNIRRIAEIIKALDTSISSTYGIRVFALQYADAKSLSAAIKELFQSQETSTRSNDPRAQLFNRFMGGGPGGRGGEGGGGGGSGSSNSGGRAGASRVVAVADERSNSVVVSAPEDVMPSIQELVKAVDTEVEDVTELRVFRLKFADPQETADLLTSLFPDTSNSQNNRGQTRFAGGRFGGGGPGGFAMGASTTTSTGNDRFLKQTRVVAVADARTGSVVVSASRTMMEQIAPMITQLDSDPAKKQRVFVYDVENTDPQAVQEVLQSLFPEQNTGNSSTRRTSTTQRQNSNQLMNRQTQTRNQSSRTGTSGNFGSSSLGGGR